MQERSDLRRIVTKPNPARSVNPEVQEAGNGVGVRAARPRGAKATPLILLSSGVAA
jgi:hypothetical protein